MEPFAAALAAAADALGRPLAAAQLDHLGVLRDRLREWNERMNLVADAADEALLHRHFIDGLVITAALDPPAGGRLADVGSGAGLPGLVIAIAAPETEVVLVESHQRRASFSELVARELDLRVTVLPRRAEEVGHDPAWRATCDRVTARRLADLNVLLEYVLPLLRVGGRAVLAKGVGLDDELAAAAGVAELLGGGAPSVVDLPVPLAPDDLPAVRRFVVVEQVGPTPDRYPRAVGRPEKRPLQGAPPP